MAVDFLDVIEVVAKMTQAGQQLRNVYQFIQGEDATADDADVIAALRGLIEQVYATFYGALSDELEFTTIELNNLTQGTFLDEDSWPSLTAGTITSDASPLQVAAVARYPTNYKGAQLRKFIPGLAEINLDTNGELGSTFFNNFSLGMVKLLVPTAAGAGTMYYGVQNTDKLRFAVAQSAIINDIVGTQRRRRQGIGV